jgi:hypothetical protein
MARFRHLPSKPKKELNRETTSCWSDPKLLINLTELGAIPLRLQWGFFMKPYALAALLCLAAPAAAEDRDEPNTLTHGMVQMTLRVGQTTQGEVFEAFGAPNITTMDAGGNEMWVYDRHATVTSDSSGGFSIGIGVGGGGSGVGGLGGLGFGKRKSKSSSSSRTMTLVIKFDAEKTVSDFRSRSSSF